MDGWNYSTQLFTPFRVLHFGFPVHFQRTPTSQQIDGNSVESVDSFVYLGSLQKSEHNSRPESRCEAQD